MARGLNWTTIQIPFVAGLETKEDPRFSEPPALDIARDVVFERPGGLQTRPPFGAVLGGGAIVGGGTLSNCRFLATVNGELCVFTDAGLYSYDSQLNAWALRGTYLAPRVDEQSRFVTTGDQIDCDRAELSGVIVFAWTEASQVYAAAIGKATGAVIVAPTAVSTAVGRPRLVALSTKILLFANAGSNNLTARAIDPASPSTAIAGAGTTVLATNYNLNYDAVQIPSADSAIVVARRSVTTSYSILKVTSALAVTAATPARTADGPVAVSVDPTGTNAQIIRVNAATVQGDLVSVSALADVFINQAIGTTTIAATNQIAACHRSVQNSGQYRCYVWWSVSEASTSVTNQFNWVDTGGSLGTAATFVPTLAPASRPFDHNGSVYIWMTFALSSVVSGFTGPSLQNTYFLYRDDQFLVAKSVIDTAGGYATSAGRLPGVALTDTNTYTWCGNVRRAIPLGNDGTEYGPRSPRDISVVFDTNSARRSAQIGKTLYIAGGEVMQYDGVRLVESGFHIYPYKCNPIDAAGGSVAPGDYGCKVTYRYVNGQGENERSTTTTLPTVTVTVAAITFATTSPLNVTHKTASPPAVEFWRTLVAPTVDSPYYLTSSNDPTQLTNPNRYFPNDQTLAVLGTYNDHLSDTSLASHEPNPENGAVLEVLAPPPASIIIATDTRLFLAGIAGDPDRIWPSLERLDGQAAGFNDALVVDVPPAGGALTALWFQDGVLYVGRATAIYALPGSGLDNLGQGQNFGPARIVSLDVGPVSQEAQALTPVGTLFKSSKGWCLLERSGTVRYVGGATAEFDDDTVLAMHVVASKHQVRVLTNNRIMMWDYRGAVDPQAQAFLGSWSEWTVSDGLHAALWNGTYVYLTATGPRVEQSAMTGMTYGLDAEMSWIKLNELQGFGKVGAIQILGEYRSDFLARIRVARDYQCNADGTVAYFEDGAWSPSPTTVGSALQVRRGLTGSNGNCEAIKVRVTAVSDASRATLVTTSLSPVVATDGTEWNSTWRAETVDGGFTAYGEMGNALTMTVAFAEFDTGTESFLPVDLPYTFTENGVVAVNDHYTWSVATGRWQEDLNNIGVVIGGDVTVAELEGAILAVTELASLITPDPTPTKTVDAAGQLGTSTSGSFSGGTYGTPTGEALRLTALGLEVGVDPRLYKRLPAEQKT